MHRFALRIQPRMPRLEVRDLAAFLQTLSGSVVEMVLVRKTASNHPHCAGAPVL